MRLALARAPARSAVPRSANVAPRRAASSKSDVQASKSSNLSAERAAQKEVVRAHRSRLASIFQNWKQTDPHEGYIYTNKDTIKAFAKRNPNALYYEIGMGRVDPEVLKELYEEERSKVVAKPQAEKDEFRRALRETVEPKLEELGWRFQNPEMVRKAADDYFYSQVDAVLDGRDTAFHFGSWRQVKTQVKFEQLMENSPLYAGLTFEQREELARNYEISLGYMTLEHTQPQPPPQHTWVEPPFVKRLGNPISTDEAKAIGSRIASQAQQLLAAKH